MIVILVQLRPEYGLGTARQSGCSYVFDTNAQKCLEGTKDSRVDPFEELAGFRAKYPEAMCYTIAYLPESVRVPWEAYQARQAAWSKDVTAGW